MWIGRINCPNFLQLWNKFFFAVLSFFLFLHKFYFLRLTFWVKFHIAELFVFTFDLNDRRDETEDGRLKAEDLKWLWKAILVREPEKFSLFLQRTLLYAAKFSSLFRYTVRICWVKIEDFEGEEKFSLIFRVLCTVYTAWLCEISLFQIISSLENFTV